ncbi:hypothetical protein K9M79_06505 [Candidatus Woesearchaeota archaeon]|nr:hypothetical protein [Candidatus Woesearchaeota archaeon]
MQQINKKLDAWIPVFDESNGNTTISGSRMDWIILAIVGSVTGKTIKNYIRYSQHKWSDVKPRSKKKVPQSGQQVVSAFG